MEVVDFGDAVKSRTVGVCFLKVEGGNPIPSVLLCKERPLDGKPAGWGIPQGNQERSESEIQTAMREFTAETRREIAADELRRAFRWSEFVPSRTEKGALHEVVIFLIISSRAPLVVVDFTHESDEIEDAKWFRLDKLPDSRFGAPMYFMHRARIAKAIRQAAEERPEMFTAYGLDAETLARMVEPKQSLRRPKT
jgi:8-oxo-dGTP pyrophosphatase MutT (NUDIX family)